MINQEFWKNKKVFLTGHTGFKGAWLSTVLLKMGAQVHGYSIGLPSTPALFSVLGLDQKIHTHTLGDINDLKKLSQAMREFAPDIILHLAAQPLVRQSYSEPMETWHTNVIGTANVMQAMRAVPSVKSAVIITTDKCYENLDLGKHFEELDPLGGRDPYSASKACAEIVTHSMRMSFFDEAKIRIVTARAGNVIGGGDWAKDRIMTDLVASVSSNKPIHLRNPNATRPWQHVLEPVVAYLKMAELAYNRKIDSQAFNIGPDPSSEKSVDFVVNAFYKSWGLTPNIQYADGPQPHEAKLLMLNIEKAKRVLNWSPRYSINEAIHETASWYQSYYSDSTDMWSLTLTQIDQYFDLINQK